MIVVCSIEDFYSSKFKVIILDSERSDERIDFTMMFYFFLCVMYTLKVVEKVLFSTFGVVSSTKLNLVGNFLKSIYSNFQVPFNKQNKTTVIFT